MRQSGAVERNRTSDLLITNQLLYQLSYNSTNSRTQNYSAAALASQVPNMRCVVVKAAPRCDNNCELTHKITRAEHCSDKIFSAGARFHAACQHVLVLIGTCNIIHIPDEGKGFVNEHST